MLQVLLKSEAEVGFLHWSLKSDSLILEMCEKRILGYSRNSKECFPRWILFGDKNSALHCKTHCLFLAHVTFFHFNLVSVKNEIKTSK